MGCKEDRMAVCSIRKEVQQGVKCWGYREAGHCLWTCSKKVACPEKGEVQQREVRRVKEDKVQRKWHQKERTVEYIGQLWK